MPDIRIGRRTVLQGLAGGGLAGMTGLAGGPSLAQGGTSGTRLIILGSRAGPVVGADRHQTSHALIVGNAVYVIDCGYGATEQLVKAGISLPDIRNIFITHHHPDHSIELGTLIYFAWYAGLERSLDVYGPPPLDMITKSYLQAIKPAVDVWLDDIGHAPMSPVTAHELSAPGPVMNDGTVTVTCAVVDHPPVVPALAYRFDTPDRSIVFSGDTTPQQAVVDLARGADVLVHEAIYPEALSQAAEGSANARPAGVEPGSAIAGDAAKLLEHVLSSHTPVEEAGRIAQEAGVGTLVLSHTVPLSDQATEEMWLEAAARHFTGRIIFAHDMTEV